MPSEVAAERENFFFQKRHRTGKLHSFLLACSLLLSSRSLSYTDEILFLVWRGKSVKFNTLFVCLFEWMLSKKDSTIFVRILEFFLSEKTSHRKIAFFFACLFIAPL